MTWERKPYGLVGRNDNKLATIDKTWPLNNVCTSCFCAINLLIVEALRRAGSDRSGDYPRILETCIGMVPMPGGRSSGLGEEQESIKKFFGIICDGGGLPPFL